MAQYLYHFLEEEIAESDIATSGWVFALIGTILYGGVRQLTDRFLGDRGLALSLSASLLGTHWRGGVQHIASASDSARADFEVRGTFKHAGSNGAGNCVTVGGRVTGSYYQTTGYFLDFDQVGDAVRIVKDVAGVETTLASGVFAQADAGLYHYVFRCVGTSLSAKYWADGSQEPSAWILTATDAAIAAAGMIIQGVRPSLGGLAACEIWYFAIGTGGSSAPARPVSWTEYLEFLDQQDALRCVLVEARALGSTSAGAAQEAIVCASNYPFVSKACDPRPHICYEEILLEAPQTRRRMGSGFRGRTTMSYGDVVLGSEGETISDPGELVERIAGRLEQWLAWNWDGREIRVLLGHPQWRRADFKTILLGTIEDVYKIARDRIGFKLRGPEALAQNAVSTALIGGSGPNAMALCPYSVTNNFFNVEPVLYDAATLAYQVMPPTGGFTVGFDTYVTAHDVRDGGVSLKKAQRTITAVDTALDEITFDAPHNWTVNAAVVFISPGNPAPIAQNQKLYVKTISAANKATFSTTKGGATLDLTSAATGGICVGYLLDWDANGRIYLLTTPANRLTVDLYFVSSSQAEPTNVAAALLGTPSFFHGEIVSQTLVSWRANQATVGEVLDELCGSVGASWCFNREGLHFLTVLDTPTGVAKWEIGADDIRNWREGERFLPRHVERLTYKPNATVQKGGDLLGAVSAADRDLYGRPHSVTGYTPSESGLRATGRAANLDRGQRRGARRVHAPLQPAAEGDRHVLVRHGRLGARGRAGRRSARHVPGRWVRGRKARDRRRPHG
jgi:hypothetical protein